MYRAFFPIYSLYLTAFYAMMMYSVFCGSGPINYKDPKFSSGGYTDFIPLWLLVSSAAAFHSALTALERFANFLLTRRFWSPLQRADAQKYNIKRKGRVKEAEGARAGGMDTDLRATRLVAPSFDMEGAPIWGIFGFLEWWILFVGLSGLFLLSVCQHHALNICTVLYSLHA